MTIVSWGEMLHRCLQAALHLSNHYGFESEVIDLRTLQPWDKKTVLQSVRKTGRLVVVHEAPKTSGFGAELVATISERISPGYNLKAPPVRVTGYDTPFPMVHEDHYVPSVRRIVRQCLKLL
jgi:pyruvate/2-oxoglutarate/acetoin dehydrogenase E1 component